jgi:uncharacterized protein (TIGR04168 family)
VRLALIGDVHLRFDLEDARRIDDGGYDAALFVGDLAGYSHRRGLAPARAIAALRTPAIVVPGNHDAVHAAQLLAEMMRNGPAAEVLGRGQRARVEALRRALGRATLAGYSVHRLGTGERAIDCVVARPHSFGGPHLAFRPYLREVFGVASMEASTEKLCAAFDRAETEHVVVLAHNGPAGLGARRSDIWGCDFRANEGDFGDPDLREGIAHAQRTGKKVVAVLAGHMHHALRGGGTRSWKRRQDGILYVNAARVPRVWKRDGAVFRHRVEVTIEGSRAEAHEVVA